jgi:minor extracellular serine protease Vpr
MDFASWFCSFSICPIRISIWTRFRRWLGFAVADLKHCLDTKSDIEVNLTEECPQAAAKAINRSIPKGARVVESLERWGRRNAAQTRVRRISVLLFGFVLAGGLALGARSAVSDEQDVATPAPFSHLDTKAFGLAGTFTPASLASDRTVGVILKLKGESVGQQRADALKQGKDLSKDQRAAIRDQLKQDQGPVADGIARLGGQVFEQYQDAYNGLAARVPLSSLPALQALPGVVAVQPDQTVTLDNTAGVQYIGGNQVWADLGRTGNGVKIGIIDTGIDYFHANFGGAGNPADFKNNNSTIIEPGSFPTAKVVGGTDFVGDGYDASSPDPAKNTPHPDPDPADCNGHGSHVAGTAAGYGVLSDGSTYTGPYDATTYPNHTFRIGPGVAPRASIYAYRVFGCSGSASDAVIVAALNQALKDGVDVANMSLGSVFGRDDAADSEASNTVAENGVVVVASAGNSGSGAYITGSPAAASRALSVAAIDASSATFPGATISLSTGSSVLAQLSNGPFQGDPGASLPSGPLGIVVLRNADGSVSLGCNASDYSGVAGKLVVVLRGVCGRVHKAILGQKAGASAVAMINTSAAFPPFEGDITSDPDTGEQIHVTIPFFGIRGTLGSTPPSDGDKLAAADGGTATSFAPTPVANAGYAQAASFTSGGPRNPDSAVKPEVMAPGVSVKSTAMGTGNEGTRLSGTSMAAPMTSGTAALVNDAHPSWSTEAIKAAIIDTAESGPSKIAGGYNVRTQGSGVVQARRAVDTVSYATTSGGRDTLDFGYHALSAAYSQSIPLTIHNTSGSAITYNLSASVNSSLGGLVSASVSPSSLTVPAGGTAAANATVSVSASNVANLPSAISSNFGGLNTARGAILATPTSAGAGIYALRVPYIFVPRGLSNVTAGAKSAYTKTGDTLNATVPLSNAGIHSGTADVYAWGIHDAQDVSGAEGSMDVRDVGVQEQPKSFLCGTSTTGVCSNPNDSSLVFAINTYGQASNPSVNEFDVAIDTQNDGRPDFFVVGVDFGDVTAAAFSGQFASFIFDKAGNLVDLWVARAPMNGSTIELPTLASEIGLDPTVNSTRFNYWVNAFSIVPGDLVDTTSVASFRTDQPPVSSGQQIPLAPGAGSTLNVSVNFGKFAGSPQLGWLVSTQDDANGAAQADEIPVGSLK